MFALSDGLRPAANGRTNLPEGAGTFHCPVVAEVTGVENLSELEAERRALQDSKLKDYALAQGDQLEGRSFEPVRQGEGVEPEAALTAAVRKSILAECGKQALDGLKCWKLPVRIQTQYVYSADPKAILVVPANYTGHGAIYSEGPVVFLDGKNRNWIQKCVSKSWVAVQGEVRLGHLTHLGKRVDLEAAGKDKPEKPKDEDE